MWLNGFVLWAKNFEMAFSKLNEDTAAQEEYSKLNAEFDGVKSEEQLKKVLLLFCVAIMLWYQISIASLHPS